MSFYKHYFKEDYINEMILKGKRIEGQDHDVLAFDKWIYLLDEGDPKLPELAMEIADKFGQDWGDAEDIHPDDIKDVIGQEFPDVLTGRIYNNTLRVENYGSFKLDPKSSILIKKVVKQLGLSDVSYTSTDGDETVSRWDIKGDIPDTMYHGTTTKYFDNISKIGLRAGEKGSNWAKEGVHHPDKIFFTSRIDEAQGHSVSTARKVGGYPIILEFKVPNKDLMIADYDVESQTGTKEFYDYHEQNPYEKTYKTKPFSVSKEFGVYGYKGSIPPKFIESVHIAFKDPDDVYGMDDYTELDVDDAKEELSNIED